jgi:hypothetical protein
VAELTVVQSLLCTAIRVPVARGELRMGKAVRDGYRAHAFLMTKIDGRSKNEATRQLEQSLRRLQTDCIDLVQHHEIIRHEDPHRIFDDDGAHAALLDAQNVEWLGEEPEWVTSAGASQNRERTGRGNRNRLAGRFHKYANVIIVICAGYAGKRGTLGRLVQSIDNPLDPMLQERLVEIDP